MDNGTGPLMTYPKAIVKQAEVLDWSLGAITQFKMLLNRFPPEIALRILSNDKACDFDITFNANLDWHFGNDTITEEQTDFKLVAAKHITQGLGFVTNLERIQVGRKSYVVPRTYYEDDPNTKYLSYMSPMDSFTKSEFVAPRNALKEWAESLFDIESEVELFEPLSITFNLFEKTGLYSKNLTSIKGEWPAPFLKVGRRLGNARKDFTILGLRTSKHELIGVTSGLFTRDDWNELEFVMTSPSSYVTGETLSDKMMVYGNGRLYGEATLAVMEAVGYATWRNPVTIEFAATNSNNNPRFPNFQ